MSGGTRINCCAWRSWRSTPRRLPRWVEGLLAILYAPRCLLCGRSLDSLSPVCAACSQALPRLSGPRCLICQQPLPEDYLDLCIRCGVHRRGLVRTVALGPYTDGWRRLILDLKAGRDRIVADFLSAKLSAELRQQTSLTPDLLTFVPMTKRERRSRGFNQSRLLATGVSHRTGVPVERLLTKQIDTDRQSVLRAEQRRNNLREAFRAVRSSTESESVLLIDDVFTTGATAEACSHALLDAGYKEVNVLVVARAEGSGPSR